MEKTIEELFPFMSQKLQKRLGNTIAERGIKGVGKKSKMIEISLNLYAENDFDNITLLAAKIVREERNGDG